MPEEEAPEVEINEAPDSVVTDIADESVNVNINVEAPDADPEPAAEAHCEHCAAHEGELAELRAAVAVLTAVEEAEIEEEAVEEEVPQLSESEPEGEKEEVKEETEPTRSHFLNRPVFGGRE